MMKQKQSGFTLIEIAIVLVIIGLLLGGVLKGQELINSAKVKNLATDFRNIPVFIYGYQDKYKALPGDDSKATSHLSGCGTTYPDCANGDGNGTIGGSWDGATIALGGEAQLFWLDVRLAGLAPGATSNLTDYRPTNSEGGAIGIQSNSGFTTITKNAAGNASAMAGTYVICSKGIPGKYVKQLDTTMDDGDTDTGSMRVTDNAGTTGQSIATANIVDGTTYIVCMGV